MTQRFEPQWHDLAARFDAGETAIASPPFAHVNEAHDFRFKFYRWRRALRHEEIPGTPLYANLHAVAVFVERTPNGQYVVQFLLPSQTAAARVLECMVREGARGSDE